MRTKLPKDGAVYPCSYEMINPEIGRCTGTATEAIGYKEYAEFVHPNIFLHGRALCSDHLVWFENQ